MEKARAMSKVNKDEREFTPTEWVSLLSRKQSPAREKCVFTRPFGKSLRINKEVWRRTFRGFEGIRFKDGKEVELINAPSGGPKTDIPAWVRQKLKPIKGDMICITKRDDRFYVKALRLVKRPSRVPGMTAVDRIGDNRVDRVHSLNCDLGNIDDEILEELLRAMPSFRHDAVAYFAGRKTKTAALVRRDVLGRSAKGDSTILRRHRADIASKQMADGSWQQSAVRTGYAIMQLLVAGADRTDPVVRKGCEWLLSCTEPTGRPGLFMYSEDMVQRYNRSCARSKGGISKGFRMASQEELPTLVEGYQSGADVYGSPSAFCGTNTLPATGVALEALLRCGLEKEGRAVRAVNTLMRMPWCESGISFRPPIEASDSPEAIVFDNHKRFWP